MAHTENLVYEAVQIRRDGSQGGIVVLECKHVDEAVELAHTYAVKWSSRVDLFLVPFVHMGHEPWRKDKEIFIVRLLPTNRSRRIFPLDAAAPYVDWSCESVPWIRGSVRTTDATRCCACEKSKSEMEAHLQREQKASPVVTSPCLTCGGEVKYIEHSVADGQCPNCGLVGFDVGETDGEPFEAYSRESFLGREAELAKVAANPPIYDPDDVPF